MKKRLALLIVMLIALVIPVGLFGLIGTEAGSHWLLRKVFLVLPAQVSVATIEGRLLDRVSLTGFHYQGDTETIAIKNLAFAWRPYELISGTLKIVDVALNGVNIGITEIKEPQEESGFDLNAERLLPVRIVVENFLLTDMQFHKADFVQNLEKLQLALATEGDQLKVSKLAINAKPIAATAQGQMTLGKGFPFSVTSDWRANGGQNGLWQGSTTITGDINKLSFDNHLSSPFKVVLKGELDGLQTTPRVSTRADWSKVVWPISGAAPQLKSEQGFVELAGLLDDYKITLNGQLTQQYLPEASLSFKGKGSRDAMSIEKLELKSKTGLFQIGGNVSWQDTPTFDLTATGQNFNPAILLPEMPGSLTFSSRLKGRLDATVLQLDAEINKLSGQLRGNPVSANGKLVLNGDQLKVDALRINSGINKIAVNGTMGQGQAALDLSIDTPALDALWPTLGGSLKGEGFVQGTWKNPTVKFQAKGKQLRFDGHSAGQVAINIDYSPDTKKTSKILLSASAIKSGTVQLDSVRVDGLGTQTQHSFKADVSSVYGDLSAALTGCLKAGNWKGYFSKLDLNSRDLGLWQLKRNLAVNLVQRPSGFDVALDEACLVQKAASICTHGHYLANGDLNIALKASALPTRLMKAYLPEQMQLAGIINADTEIQQQKGLLTGRYQMDMSPAKLSLQGKEVPLGASTLSGKIKGNTLSAGIDLALAGQDYLRGQLQMDTGKSQAISGQISASLRELAMLEVFVPQLSGTKGLLTADIRVKGTAKKPVVTDLIDPKSVGLKKTHKHWHVKLNVQMANIRFQGIGSLVTQGTKLVETPTDRTPPSVIDLSKKGTCIGH
jgi:translocation and assembly module TamB